MSPAPTLAHSIVTAPGTAPRRWMLFLHGIFGSGANWRTFARRFVTAHPTWGAVLVDLRMHGASQDFSAPHTIESAAHDLAGLDAIVPGPIRAIVGHSFGGKVTMEAIRQRHGALDAAWIIDSMPGSRPDARGSESTTRVLEILQSMPRVFESREDFVDRLAAAGIGDLAQWLAMNLRREGETFVLRSDLAAITAMMHDYLARDLWPILEHPAGSVKIHLVIGGKSNIYDPGDRKRAAELAAGSGGRVAVHTLENAGHWVHVDDPDGLFNVLSSTVPA